MTLFQIGVGARETARDSTVGPDGHIFGVGHFARNAPESRNADY